MNKMDTPDDSDALYVSDIISELSTSPLTQEEVDWLLSSNGNMAIVSIKDIYRDGHEDPEQHSEIHEYITSKNYSLHTQTYIHNNRIRTNSKRRSILGTDEFDIQKELFGDLVGRLYTLTRKPSTVDSVYMINGYPEPVIHNIILLDIHSIYLILMRRFASAGEGESATHNAKIGTKFLLDSIVNDLWDNDILSLLRYLIVSAHILGLITDIDTVNLLPRGNITDDLLDQLEENCRFLCDLIYNHINVL